MVQDHLVGGMPGSDTDPGAEPMSVGRVGPYLGAGGLAGQKQSGACSAQEGKPKSLPNGAADQHSQRPILQSLNQP